MDKAYLKAESIIWSAHRQLLEIQQAANDSGDNASMAFSLQNSIDELEDYLRNIEYFKKDVKEGILILDPVSEKFFIRFKDGTESGNLSCASPIEWYDEELEEWNITRVEHDTKLGYYFYRSKKSLAEELKVRRRI